MSRDPAATARAAFAMASRTELLEGQRAAALNRGMAIVDKYKLDPDDFDIPGRTPKRPADQPTCGGRPIDLSPYTSRLMEAERIFRETQRAIYERRFDGVIRNDGC